MDSHYINGVNWQVSLVLLVFFACVWNCMLFAWRDGTLRVFAFVFTVAFAAFGQWHAFGMSIAALVWVMLSSIEFDWSQLPVSKYHAEFEMVLPITNFNMETAILQAATGCGWVCGPVINNAVQATTGIYRCIDQGGFEGLLGGRKLSDTIDISWKVDGRCIMFNVDSYEPTGYREPIIHRRDKKSVKMFQTKLEDIVNRMLTSKP